MGNSLTPLTRKNFIQLSGLAGLAAGLPPRLLRVMELAYDWPVMQLRLLPQQIQPILQAVPDLQIDTQGYINYRVRRGSSWQRLPLAQTQWNLEHSQPWDQLDSDVPWGIVLHWFGDEAGFDQSVEGYLRGFNAMRQVASYTTRTSAHFLVGASDAGVARKDEPTAILQTQIATNDGTPYVASQLQALDYQAHAERRQYFVRALYELGYREPTIHSILQDWFDGQKVDPNMRSLAIELTGGNFDDPEHYPSVQQLANALGVVWAVMRRYNIRASSILGHDEIQIDKPDPGKSFMALMRLLVAAKALTENDPLMNELVFGQHVRAENQPAAAVRIYLRWVRDYLVKVSRPIQVFTWEAQSGYWYLWDAFAGELFPTATSLIHPLPGAKVSPTYLFSHPGNHEGVDLYVQAAGSHAQMDVGLIADGKCLYAGDSYGFHPGKQAIFRHRQPDGAEIISIYGNLSSLGMQQVDGICPQGYRVGSISSNISGTMVLHFAIAYQTTWERWLSTNPDAAYSSSPDWVTENYLEPMEYLNQRMSAGSSLFNYYRINQPH